MGGNKSCFCHMCLLNTSDGWKGGVKLHTCFFGCCSKRNEFLTAMSFWHPILILVQFLTGKNVLTAINLEWIRFWQQCQTLTWRCIKHLVTRKKWVNYNRRIKGVFFWHGFSFGLETRPYSWRFVWMLLEVSCLRRNLCLQLAVMEQ